MCFDSKTAMEMRAGPNTLLRPEGAKLSLPRSAILIQKYQEDMRLELYVRHSMTFSLGFQLLLSEQKAQQGDDLKQVPLSVCPALCSFKALILSLLPLSRQDDPQLASYKLYLTPLTTSTSPPAVAANNVAVWELQLSFVESQRSTFGILLLAEGL